MKRFIPFCISSQISESATDDDDEAATTPLQTRQLKQQQQQGGVTAVSDSSSRTSPVGSIASGSGRNNNMKLAQTNFGGSRSSLNKVLIRYSNGISIHDFVANIFCFSAADG